MFFYRIFSGTSEVVLTFHHSIIHFHETPDHCLFPFQSYAFLARIYSILISDKFCSWVDRGYVKLAASFPPASPSSSNCSATRTTPSSERCGVSLSKPRRIPGWLRFRERQNQELTGTSDCRAWRIDGASVAVVAASSVIKAPSTHAIKTVWKCLER